MRTYMFNNAAPRVLSGVAVTAALLLSVSSVSLIGQSQPIPQGQALPRRFVQRSPNTPISQLLRANDKDIDLVDNRDLPMPMRDEHRQLLPVLTRSADLIAIIELANIDSALTPDRTWVMSTATGRIVETLKAPQEMTSRFPVGASIQFDWEGGVVTLDGHGVHARVAGVRDIRPGTRYLAFATVLDGGALLVAPSTIYEVSPASMRSMLDSAQADDIASDTVASVKRRIATIAKEKQR